tara:strand:+ start:1132 stop:1911 length:780 start_codon:yes stop_codon:yes gene_type:complete
MNKYNNKQEKQAKEEDKHRNKAPSFQFYAQDFLTGTMDMNMIERGIYITLLSVQWSKRVIQKSRVGIVLNDSSLKWERLPDIVKDKFIDYKGVFATSDDCIINQRLFDTMMQQILFYRKQRLNGIKGGRPKYSENKPTKNPNANPKQSSSIEVRRKKKESEEEIVYPYDDKTFKAVWRLWKEYKLLEFNFKFKSRRGEQASLNQLFNQTQDMNHAIKTINNSMANGWRGCYPKKELNIYEKKEYSNDLKDEIFRELQSD